MTDKQKELRQKIWELKAKESSLAMEMHEVHNDLNVLRATCSHEPIRINETLMLCEVCGVRLEGCLASLSGKCSYDENSELCIFCGVQKHAVEKPIPL